MADQNLWLKTSFSSLGLKEIKTSQYNLFQLTNDKYYSCLYSITVGKYELTQLPVNEALRINTRNERI